MSKKNTKKSHLSSLLSKDESSKLEEMLTTRSKSPSAEFEVSYHNINYSNYMRIVEHFINETPEDKISSSEMLDVTIQLPGEDTLRVSFLDHDDITAFLKKFERSRHGDLHRYLQELEPKKDLIEMMYKDRGSAMRLHISELDMSAKVSTEKPLHKKDSKSMKLSGSEKLLFRYKQRASFDLESGVRVDITDVKEATNLWTLSKIKSKYELEAEVINQKISFDTLLEELSNILEIVQDSTNPLTKTESHSVIQSYKELLKLRNVMHLESRNPVTLHNQHIVNFIPNRYAITDKADGDRFFMFILETGCYLISTNLTVIKTSLTVKKEKYWNTLLDGELIVTETGKSFLIFDVIHANGKDFRHDNEYDLPRRISIMNDVINDVFGTLIPFPGYVSKSNNLEIDLVRTYYKKELQIYWDQFKKDSEKAHKEKRLYVTRKLYFVPYGFESCEVFTYANLVWKSYVYEKLAPYKLDGIIYTPINKPYMIRSTSENQDATPQEYKWKRPQQNSIDFYIRFEKDTNGNETVFFDNAVSQDVGKSYKMCRLFVGVINGPNEKPIPFKVKGVEQRANIYITDGEARDIEGKIVEDNTVVEFVYDASKNDLEDAYRWIPLRTRYDKTESIIKYGKRYGNNLNVAIRIWHTILNPITEDNIASLGEPSSYQREMDILAKGKQNQGSSVYYQKKTDEGKGMRAFHNWIKANMISTYGQNKKTVLDIGCGRGGDLQKFTRLGNIEEYVGTDIDNNGLYIINGSANDRYKSMRKTMPKIPPMYFINADSRGLFDVDSQLRIFPSMSDTNKDLINRFLSGNKKYDLINCQFTLHYYLSDELSWSNFCQNITDHINDNGYFLITCFDGDIIYDKLKGKQKLLIEYTDGSGNKNTFSEIRKIYNDSDQKTIGVGIDVYNSLISEPNEFIREYLVFPEFLEKSLKEKCGLELVETSTFYDLFHLYKNFFTHDEVEAKSEPGQSGGKKEDEEESNPTKDRRKTKNKEKPESDQRARRFGKPRNKMFDEVQKYYSVLNPAHKDQYSVEEIDSAIASFKVSILNRYYVFQKKANIDITSPSRLVGINQHLQMGKVLTPYFKANQLIVDIDNETNRINKLYDKIKLQYVGAKPSVYLIKNSIVENSIGSEEVLRTNRVGFYQIKEGKDPKILLIYKSPENRFSPLYYYDSDGEPNHLLNSEGAIEDLNILVGLTERLNDAINAD